MKQLHDVERGREKTLKKQSDQAGRESKSAGNAIKIRSGCLSQNRHENPTPTRECSATEGKIGKVQYLLRWNTLCSSFHNKC